MAEPSLILRWVALWHERVGKWQRRVSLGLVLAALIGAAHLGRIGTPGARLGALALLLVSSALGIARVVRERRALSTPRAALRRIVVPIDPEGGAKALRAEALVTRARDDQNAGSLELSRLHLSRVLARVSIDRVERAARQHGLRLFWVAFGLIFAALAGVFVAPMRVVEGLDVLLARRGVAPVPLEWLQTVRVTVQPPSYLRKAEHAIMPWGSAELPAGSSIVVRGVPARLGRSLVLGDGKTEVEFIDDGADGVVARWALDGDTTLRVMARFGAVVVPEPQALEIKSLEDRLPEVVLEGAPQSLALKELERLEFRYLVKDDNGLEQIDLV